jgi:EthD domain
VIKFQLISRRKPGDTQEKYFYEWGINDVDGGRLLYPLSGMEWDNFADHWLERPEDNLVPFRSDDYLQRMHPHNFGDSNFIIEYLSETLRDEAPEFEPGGVKLVHVVRSRPGMEPVDFAATWRDRHAAALLTAGATRPGRLVQNLHAEVRKETFAGTLFELAGVGGYAGIEELWFPDLDALLSFTEDAGVRAAVLSGDAPVDPAGSFSMVVTERVVYDYTLGDGSSPRPAVLDPDSLEAHVDAQRYEGWNVPGWERRMKERA